MSVSQRAAKDEIVPEMHEPHVHKGKVDVQGDDQDGEEEDEEWRFAGSSSGRVVRYGLLISARQVVEREDTVCARWRREQGGRSCRYDLREAESALRGLAFELFQLGHRRRVLLGRRAGSRCRGRQSPVQCGVDGGRKREGPLGLL